MQPGCGAPDPLPSQADSAAALAIGATDSSSWVALYEPRQAASGYNLAFYRQRIPMIFDMNGRIVHSWPEVRAKSRLRLLPDGSLMTIDLGRSVTLWSWEGDRLWRWRSDREIPHHDFQRLANGHALIVIRKKGKPTDELIEVDSTGDVVWRWDSAEPLAAFLGRVRRGQRHDLTHINSVQELPENRHHATGDDRFRPGNLLISARNLSTIFVIDRATGAVVWDYSRKLDYQHEALMIEPDAPGAGNIQIFNNGYRGRYRYRSSKVVEIDPASGETVWSYSDPTFFSATSGVEQPLPNGNVLISSSRGGRAFEVTRTGDLVWQWTPPYSPRRPHRLAYDHCPQLAALGRSKERPVKPAPGYRFVDRGVYRFARRGKLQEVEVDGVTRRVLRETPMCVPMVLPDGAGVALEYGVDRGRLGTAGASSVDFSVELRGVGEPIELWRDTIELDADLAAPKEPWRSASIDLADHFLQAIELCVATEAEAESPPLASYAFWANPQISSASSRARSSSEATDDLAPDELEVQLEHLKALGYVD